MILLTQRLQHVRLQTLDGQHGRPDDLIEASWQGRVHWPQLRVRRVSCRFVDCTDPRRREHIAELNNTKPKQPFFFLKPSTAIVLPGEGPCLRPKGIDLHFEVELALVIGKVVRDLQAEDAQGALDAIQGEFPALLVELLE